MGGVGGVGEGGTTRRARRQGRRRARPDVPSRPAGTRPRRTAPSVDADGSRVRAGATPFLDSTGPPAAAREAAKIEGVKVLMIMMMMVMVMVNLRR